MKPLAGLPKTWPKPFGSEIGLLIAAKNVSLVPRLITAVPGRAPPQPIRLFGLSPEKTYTAQFLLKPNFSTKYELTVPALESGLQNLTQEALK